jgi:hypothetical protein
MPTSVASSGYYGVVTSKQNNYPTWEYDLIRTLGGKPNPVNLQVLDLWAQKEGVTQSAHNWLAVSAPPQYPLPGMSGTLSGNADSIATFASTSAGVNGIATFLRNGYPNLVKALIDPSSGITDITRHIPVNAWGGDAAYINAHAGDPVNTPVYTGGAPTGQYGSTPGKGSTSFTNCTGATVIGGGGLGFKINLLNSCQAKALVGGMLIGVGAALLTGGIAIIFAASAAESKLGQAAIGLTPFKAAAPLVAKAGSSVGSLFSKSSSPPAVTAPAPRTREQFTPAQQAMFDRERAYRARQQAA